MNNTQSATLRLQQILLSWDYWDLTARSDNGEGAMPVERLKKVPGTFASVQVRHHIPHMVAGSETND